MGIYNMSLNDFTDAWDASINSINNIDDNNTNSMTNNQEEKPGYFIYKGFKIRNTLPGDGTLFDIDGFDNSLLSMYNGVISEKEKEMLVILDDLFTDVKDYNNIGHHN